MTSDVLLFMKSAKATDLFLINLILIKLPVKRLVSGPGFILTSPERINISEGVCYPTNMSLHCQKDIVNTVETRVNARLKLYGGRVISGGIGCPNNQKKVKTEPESAMHDQKKTKKEKEN